MCIPDKQGTFQCNNHSTFYSRTFTLDTTSALAITRTTDAEHRLTHYGRYRGTEAVKRKLGSFPPPRVPTLMGDLSMLRDENV